MKDEEIGLIILPVQEKTRLLIQPRSVSSRTAEAVVLGVSSCLFDQPFSACLSKFSVYIIIILTTCTTHTRDESFVALA